MRIYHTYNLFSNCNEDKKQTVYIGLDREMAVKLLMQNGSGDMTTSCYKFIETWVDGNKVSLEKI